MKPDVLITGAGVVSCAGNRPDQLWSRARHHESGLKSGLGRIERSADSGFPEPAFQFCKEAAISAMRQAGWDRLREDDGIILATTTGQILSWDRTLVQLLDGSKDIDTFRQAFVTQPLGVLLARLTKELGSTVHQQLVSSACTASTQALALAAIWLQQGKVKRCLVGGVEVLCDLTLEGFKGLQLLSSENTKPFDESRKGISLSEGAGFLCLETKTSATSAPLGKISGFGMSTDGFHMTSPHPEGRGCVEAMTAALKTARLQKSDVDWIHAHGTGSYYNDLSEGLAIKTLFGENSPYVCSTKAIHGHALGASGIIEAMICLSVLKHQEILRTPGMTTPDSKIPVRHPEKAHQSHKVQHILKNTLGFGGANAAIVFSQYVDGV